MGLFDGLLNQLTGGTGQMAGAPQGLAHGVLEMLQQQPGGLNGLLGQFQSGGLANIFQSWVSTGQNLPISPQQIQNVLGSDAVQQLAAKAGINPQDAAAHLSNLLPALVDKLTPNGQVPQGNPLEQLQGLLGGLGNLGGNK